MVRNRPPGAVKPPLELPAQSAHENIDCPLAVRHRVSPDKLIDLVAPNDTAIGCRVSAWPGWVALDDNDDPTLQGGELVLADNDGIDSAQAARRACRCRGVARSVRAVRRAWRGARRRALVVPGDRAVAGYRVECVEQGTADRQSLCACLADLASDHTPGDGDA
jgi:hypothetical protein